MRKFRFTVWALVLNVAGVTIFKPCFAAILDNEFGENSFMGPPITSMLFAAAAFVVVDQLNLYPCDFVEIGTLATGVYEFVATVFLLELSMACIWSAIDYHIFKTLPILMCKLLLNFGLDETTNWLIFNKFFMSIVCLATSFGLFLLSLHVTSSIDFSIYSECGVCFFVDHVKYKFKQKLANEFPWLSSSKRCNTCHQARSRRWKKKKCTC